MPWTAFGRGVSGGQWRSVGACVPAAIAAVVGVRPHRRGSRGDQPAPATPAASRGLLAGVGLDGGDMAAARAVESAWSEAEGLEP